MQNAAKISSTNFRVTSARVNKNVACLIKLTNNSLSCVCITKPKSVLFVRYDLLKYNVKRFN